MKLTNEQIVFNSLNCYEKCSNMYDKGTKEANTKIKQSGDRNDVYHIKRYTIDNDEMFVAFNSQHIKFIFIGSNDIRDWVNNADAREDEREILDEKVMFHEGFLRSTEKFNKIIDELVEKHGQGKMVHFIGHSRGGALTLIAAVLFQNRNRAAHKQVLVVTSGQPRVSNYKLSDVLVKLGIEYHRVIYTRDIVCDLPPIELGYEHPWNNPVHIFPTKWWMRMRVFFKRTHLYYPKSVKKWLYPIVKTQEQRQRSKVRL